MCKDCATFDDHLGQVKIDLHSFFDSQGDWTTRLGPTTVTFEIVDPDRLVADEHMREREELLQQRGDFDGVPHLGTVTVTMEYTPQRLHSSPHQILSAADRPRGTPRHTSRSPGRPLRPNPYEGRLEAEREAAARRRRARSRSPRSVRSVSNSRSEDWRAWWEEAEDALNGRWTAVGGEDRDVVELCLHTDLSITGQHLDMLGPDNDPADILDGELHPPRQTRGNGAVMSGPDSPGWQRSFELRRAKAAGPIELGTVSFVQRFRDKAETKWTATLFSSATSGSSPYMDGHWSGACEGSFRAHKASGSRRPLSAAGGGLDGVSLSTVYPNASSIMGDYGVPRTPARRNGAPLLPKGMLSVKLIRAEGLITAATSGAIANCYGKLQLMDGSGQGQSEPSKTKTISNERNPEFNHTCTFHVDGVGSSSPSSRLGDTVGPTLQVTMMDKGTFSDSFLGTASIRIADLFGYSSKIADGGSETIEDAYELADEPPDKMVKKELFERRKLELAERSAIDGEQDNPHGYVRISLVFTPDQISPVR